MYPTTRWLSVVILSLIGPNVVAAQADSADGSANVTAASPQAIVVGQGVAEISLREIDAYAEAFPNDNRGQLFDDPQRIQKILHNLLADEQLAAEARELGLDKDPVVQARMQQAAERVLAKVRMDALQSKLETEMPDLTQLARERYIADPKRFVVPAKVDVKHILIGIEDRSDAQAKALAEKLHAELLADPAKFAAYVEKYSDDSSKARNDGFIINATSDQLVVPFREAAGKLQDVGEISEPVETQYGYHILKLIRSTPAHQPSFEEVRDDLIAELRDATVAKKLQAHLDQVRAAPLRDIDPDLVASLRTRYYPDHERPTLPAPATSTR